MLTLEFTAMNTAVLLAAEGSQATAAALNTARALIEDLEHRFSRFQPESEVSRLNRSAGTWSSASPELMEMLELSTAYFRETNGLFDPSILPALRRAGYDRSMDQIRRDGASASWKSALPMPVDFSQIGLDVGRGAVRLATGMEIDLGGIAKGWIAERAASAIESVTSVCAVSAGGDIVFRGPPGGSDGWSVNIEDPRDPTRTVMTLRLGPCAVATSSVVKRSWLQGNIRRHHLIDPRTAEPAVTDALSVTVVAPHMALAEVYAKALLLAGSGPRRQLAVRRPELEYYLVGLDGRLILGSAGVEHELEDVDDHQYITSIS